MTIHPDIHRALLAHGGNLQDAYRTAWMESIPAQFRRAGTTGSTVQKSPLERGTETQQERAAARRAELAKVILPLHDTGASVPRLALAAKCAEATVRRILHESGHTPNVAPVSGIKRRDWDALVPRALELRSKGMAWSKIGKTMGVCATRISEACKARGARQ